MDSFKQYQEKRISEIKVECPDMSRTEILDSGVDFTYGYVHDYLPGLSTITNYRIAYWLVEYFGYCIFWEYLAQNGLELDQHVWDLVIDKQQQREHPHASI